MTQENQMNIVIEEFNKFSKTTLLSKTRMPENVRFPQSGAQNNKGWRMYCSRVGGALNAGKVHLSSG